jgi:hypothetical protein
MKAVSFDAIRLQGTANIPSAADFAALERAFSTALPERYREFLERFGTGEYCNVLGIRSPLVAIEKTETVRKYEVFTANAQWSNVEILTPQERETLVVIATSIDGDELAFVAGAPDKLFVFPRHLDEIDAVGPTFADALAWFSHSEKQFERAETLTHVAR